MTGSAASASPDQRLGITPCFPAALLSVPFSRGLAHLAGFSTKEVHYGNPQATLSSFQVLARNVGRGDCLRSFGRQRSSGNLLLGQQRIDKRCGGSPTRTWGTSSFWTTQFGGHVKHFAAHDERDRRPLFRRKSWHQQRRERLHRYGQRCAIGRWIVLSILRRSDIFRNRHDSAWQPRDFGPSICLRRYGAGRP